MTMKIYQFVQNLFGVNTFLIWDDTTKEALLIDPGCSMPGEEEEIDEFIKEKGLSLKYLINTHGHIDHIFGNAYIKNKYNPVFLAPQGDLFLFDIMVEHAGDFGVTMTPSPQPDEFITEDKVLSLGNLEMKFISTPGHTPDGYCVYFEKEKVCFSGDTLFNESIGRTDLWGGSFPDLLNSIKTKLMTLPDNIVIYPGHGEKTSIGYERDNNPFLN